MSNSSKILVVIILGGVIIVPIAYPTMILPLTTPRFDGVIIDIRGTWGEYWEGHVYLSSDGRRHEWNPVNGQGYKRYALERPPGTEDWFVSVIVRYAHVRNVPSPPYTLKLRILDAETREVLATSTTRDPFHWASASVHIGARLNGTLASNL